MLDHLDEAKVVVVTTNSTINQRGELVMGRGAALAMKKAFPGIASEFGARVKSFKKWAATEDYLFLNHLRETKILGILQVKRHFKDTADFELIRQSLDMFRHYARGMKGACPDCRIFLNFPGIGAGKLADRYDDILKLLKRLPDNVHVWVLKRA